MEKEREQFFLLLDGYEKISIISHINPDADAIGTSLGVADLLRSIGKRVEVANASSDIPLYLDFLKGYSSIKRAIEYDDSLVITCDCSSIDRAGFDIDGRVVVNIDHHFSNTKFGNLNIVDPDAVSSSQVAFDLLKERIDITAAAAEAFYAALISDTRNFTTYNVDIECFKSALELIELGANPAKIARDMILRRSLASLRILGKAIESMRLYMDGTVAILRVKLEDLQSTGAKGSDLDGIVDYARSLATVKIAALLVERKDHIKVSLRSKGDDVSKIAREFGGGGHINASGFEAYGVRMEDLESKVLTEIKKHMEANYETA